MPFLRIPQVPVVKRAAQAEEPDEAPSESVELPPIGGALTALKYASSGARAAAEHTGVDRRKRDFGGRRPKGGAGQY